MELKDIEALLDAKIDPIKETISRLEKQQERIVEIVSNQAVMMNTIKHIENTIDMKIQESNKVHDSLFKRLRQLEEKSSDKLWDIIKLFLAGAAGAIGAKIGWK